VTVESPAVHTAKIDLTAGRLLTRPELVDRDGNRPTGWGAWSPNGSRLAYVASPVARFSSTIAFHDIETGDSQSLTLPIATATDLNWSADGRSLFVFAYGARGEQGLQRIELASGLVQTVPTPALKSLKDVYHRGYSLDAEARTMYVRRVALMGGEGAVLRYDFARDSARVLYPARGAGMVGVSPDGHRIAWTDNCFDCSERSLRIGSADGAQTVRTIYRFENMKYLGARSRVEWTPDGKHLLFLDFEPGDTSSVAIRMIPAEGGEARTIYRQSIRESGNIVDFRLDPKGKRVTFVTGRTRQEIWVMEGIGPHALAR
jgi:dipeptidyl aminopeptidase/acylaminoacyl peptidase